MHIFSFYAKRSSRGNLPCTYVLRNLHARIPRTLHGASGGNVSYRYLFATAERRRHSSRALYLMMFLSISLPSFIVVGIYACWSSSTTVEVSLEQAVLDILDRFFLDEIL